MLMNSHYGSPRTFTDEELNTAWAHFIKDHDYVDLDRDVHPLLGLRDRRDWLQSTRLASNLSLRVVDARLGNASKAFWYFERAEEAGTISLNSLHKCAEALDCELVYGLRPKVKKTFARALWDELLNIISTDNRLLCRIAENRGRSIATAMQMLVRHPEFRGRRGLRPAGDDAGDLGRELRKQEDARRAAIASFRAKAAAENEKASL